MPQHTLRSHVDAVILEYIFPREWHLLTNSEKSAIIRDCTEDEGVEDLREYSRAIGAGNLISYARTMIAQFARNDRTDREKA